MSAAIDHRLGQIIARFEEIQALLASGESSGEEFSRLSRDYAAMEEPVAAIRAWQEAQTRQQEAQALLADPEMKELAEQELKDVEAELPGLEQAMRLALLPRDSADERSAILEVRPAAGGDEAALFASELFEGYRRFAEKHGWRFEVMSLTASELSGMKEGIATISGRGVFARFKYESGVHRVQRVPATESQGRIHTSKIGRAHV